MRGNCLEIWDSALKGFCKLGWAMPCVPILFMLSEASISVLNTLCWQSRVMLTICSLPIDGHASFAHPTCGQVFLQKGEK